MAVFDTQHPWALAFGLLGNLISCMVILAPVSTFYRIYKKKTTEGFQSLPYLVALFSCMLWLYYALLKTNAVLLITINGFGGIVEAIYVVLYVVYATKDARTMTIKLFLAMNVALFSMIVAFAHFALEESTRVQALGWTNVAVSVCVFAAPLSVIAQVVKTKSVEFMPFNLSFFLTISGITWFCYGLLDHDKCVAIPNVVGILLGVVQMVVYGMYRNSANKIVEEKKLPGEIKRGMILETIKDGDQAHGIIIDVKGIKSAKQEEGKVGSHEKNMGVLDAYKVIEVV